tara:strand:- start:6797 stop:7582 length:786 start_codon:yes stop_codon:yes gene_type:complete
MPRIQLVDVPLHDPLDPYHFRFDNMPLQALITRQEIINDAVDINKQIMTESIGTQGTLANRLAQSIADNGDLKTAAVDDAQHSIENHTDNSSFVRMTKSERDKLALVDDEANELTLRIEFDDAISSDDIAFNTGEVIIEDTSTVKWEVAAPNKLRANLGFPIAAAHQHFYDLKPVHQNTVSPDFKNYKVTTVSTAFVDGALRIYINGTRISEFEDVYVPDAITDTQSLIKFTPSASAGTFVLSKAITDDDVIRIDFDTSFV